MTDSDLVELFLARSEGAVPALQAQYGAYCRAVAGFLRAQAKEVRVAFVRRYWYADTVEQTARRLGWGVSKTKSVLFRARNRLRDQLQKEGFL